MPVSNRAIATPRGLYVVQGVDRFAVGGNLDLEIRAAVEAHVATHGKPPLAVVWDDAVLDYRAGDLTFNLTQVFIPPAIAFIAGAIDNSARAAIRADSLPAGEESIQTNIALRDAIAKGEDTIARAPRLSRFLGWPETTPLQDWPTPRPQNRAQSISAVISYRGKAHGTIACIEELSRQVLDATLEIILVDNQSTAQERGAVDAALARLSGIRTQHLRYDAAFNHSYQCNYGAAAASGDVLLILSNDCTLSSPDTLQTLANWALEPGVGTVGPRLVAANGRVACAGLTIAPRVGAPGLRVIEADVDHLSRLVRYTDGSSFTCAAVSRANWLAVGGADGAAFPFGHNDADFCLRLSQTGLRHLLDGTVQACRNGGQARWRERSEALQDKLAARHVLESLPQRNPHAVTMRTLPVYSSLAAEQACDLIRLYRLARAARDTVNMAMRPLLMAFEDLIAIGSAGPGDDLAGWRVRLVEDIRAACAAYLQFAPDDKQDSRMARVFPVSANAFAELAMAVAGPPEPVPVPADAYLSELQARQPAQALAAPAVEKAVRAPAAGNDPDPDREFFSHSDVFTGARHRILVLADAFGPTQQIYFLSALERARVRGEVATRILTEEDLLTLRTRRGPQGLASYLRDTMGFLDPTAIVFSRLGDPQCHAAIQAALAAAPRAALIAHLDDDLFCLPVVTGVDRYRSGRNPRRIHALAAIAAGADLILATTPILAQRLAARFGAARVGYPDVFAGGEPFRPSRPPGPLTIGYFGSAAHNRDLEMVAPALRQIKAEHPEIRIEMVGSIAKRGVSVTLGDLVTRNAALEHDYNTFRAGMRDWGWDIGLAPLAASPFNAAKTPIKWMEYAQAGIATIASRADPYLDLARQGALLTARPDEWQGRLEELIRHPVRRQALVDTSNRLLATVYRWERVEEAFLGLLDRAAAARQIRAA